MNNNKNIIFTYEKKPFEIIRLIIKNFLFFLIQSKSKRIKPIALFNKGYVSERIIIDGEWCPEITNLIRKFAALGFNECFIDIGANIGAITMEVSNCFVNNICFEPVNFNYQLAKYNLSNNKNVNLFKKGISDKNTITKIKLPFSDYGSASVIKEKEKSEVIQEEVIVEDCELIDGFNLGKIISDLKIDKNKYGVIKIDVEGQEVQVIKALVQANFILNNVIILELDSYKNFKEIESILSEFSKYFYFYLDYSARKSKLSLLSSIFLGTKVKLKKLPKSFKCPIEVVVIPNKLNQTINFKN